MSDSTERTTVRRAEIGKGFVPLSRDVLQNESLSWGALGLYGYLMSLPEGEPWPTVGEIARVAGESPIYIADLLAELRAVGAVV